MADLKEGLCYRINDARLFQHRIKELGAELAIGAELTWSRSQSLFGLRIE